MFKLARPFFLLCETPLHAGSGNDLGVVDLPIQRERHTDFPKIESSSLKGGLRESFENPNCPNIFSVGTKKLCSDIGKHENNEANRKAYKEAIDLAFGPESTGDSGHAGALGFTDARLLLFPVKSMRGVFAWITCPMVLNRLEDDFRICGLSIGFSIPNANTAPSGCNLMINDKVALEEYVFSVKMDTSEDAECTKMAKWITSTIFPSIKAKDQPDPYAYWRKKLEKDIIVLEDDAFKDFVTLSTEVITRTKINSKTGTVQTGALFSEEYLPSETILYSLAMTTPIFKKDDKSKGIFHQENGPCANKEEALVMEFFTNGVPKMIQLGGNATIGKGLLRINFLEVQNA